MQEIVVKESSGEVVKKSLNGVIDAWLAFLDKKEATKKSYRKAMRCFCRYLEDQQIIQPKRADILKYKKYLLETYKPTTSQLYLETIKLFFGWTEYMNLYPNICQYVDGIQTGRAHKDGFLEDDEAWKLLHSIERETEKDYRDYALLSLMMTTGIRRVEVSKADVADLKRMNHEIVLYVFGKGRSGKQDFVKVPIQVADAIAEYLDKRGYHSGPLFAGCSNRNKQGSRLHPDSITRIVAKRLQAAGLKEDWITAHSLRHTAATLNLSKGGSLEETMQMLRHTNLNTTLIYAHALQRKNNRSEQRVADAIYRNDKGD